jgi:predicted helicase
VSFWGERLVHPTDPAVSRQGRTANPVWGPHNESTLRGAPSEAWEFRLGTYTALEWVLERVTEKKPKDPTIREKFNAYRFKDYKEQVIDLLGRVCRVSVETVRVVREMEG